MKNDDWLKNYRDQQKRLQEMALPKELTNIRKLMGLDVYEKIRSYSGITKHTSQIEKFHIKQRSFNNLYKSMMLANKNFSSATSLYGKYRLGEHSSFALDMANKNQEILKAFGRIDKISWQNRDLFPHRAEMTRISSTLASIWEGINISEIDVSGLNELLEDDNSISEGPHLPSSGQATLPGTITVNRPSKQLVDMTEEDLNNLINKAVDKRGVLSLGAFFAGLYAEYVNDAARVILEVMLAFCFTFITGQYNDEVKSEIVDTIQESMVVKDTRKVITKYVKANPTDQVAFLRKDSYLRKGTSKTSPVVPGDKISKVTVLTIIERKNNWVKVEVDTGESCGEIGWVEESKVIKFKRLQ